MVFSYRVGRKIPSFKEQFNHWRDPPNFSMQWISTLIPPEEVKILEDFRDSLKTIQIKKDTVTLYYPGCGLDLMRPLAILSAVADKATSWNLVFQDPAESIDPIIGVLQSITGVIPHKKKSASWQDQSAWFQFKNRTVAIALSRSDALTQFPSSIKPSESYDIYFDRAFEIVRCKDESYLDRMTQGLSPGGIVITDSKFPDYRSLKSVDVSFPSWGFYKSPAVCQKHDSPET